MSKGNFKMAYNPPERTAKLEESRQKFFDESRFDAYKPKYGLFSAQGPLAVGENSYSKGTLPRKLPDGSVETQPRNFLASGNKRGKTPDVYFSSAYAYPKEPYKNPERPQKDIMERAKRMIKTHETAFKPGGPVKQKFTDYEHKSEEKLMKKSRRLEDGTVATEPKNFYTSPPKKGAPNTTPGTAFTANYEHIPDPYERKHLLQSEEKKKSKAKMQEAPFKSMAYGRRSFFDDKKTYGEDVELKKKEKPPRQVATANHDRPFIPNNPTKKGATIGKFPDYMPNPPKEVKRKQPSSEVPWRTSYRQVSKPSPSVNSIVSNLRSEYPALKRLR